MDKYFVNFLLSTTVNVIILIVIFTINIVTNNTGILSIISFISSVTTLVIAIVSLNLLNRISVVDFNKYWFNILIKISVGLTIISITCLFLIGIFILSPPITYTLL